MFGQVAMEDKSCDTSQLQEFIAECLQNSKMDEEGRPLGHSSPIPSHISPRQPYVTEKRRSVSSDYSGSGASSQRRMSASSKVENNSGATSRISPLGRAMSQKLPSQQSRTPSGSYETPAPLELKTSPQSSPKLMQLSPIQRSETQPQPVEGGTSSRKSSKRSESASVKLSAARTIKSGKSSERKPVVKRQDSQETVSSNVTNFSDELLEQKTRATIMKGRRASVLPSPDLDSEGLKIMDCSCQGMTSIPTHILTDKKIGTLVVTGNNLRTIPQEIRKMKRLHCFDLSKNALKCLNDDDYIGIPVSVNQLKHLRVLRLSECNLAFIPAAIWSLVSLESLDISRNKIGVLHPKIGNLTNLRKLNLQQTDITSLPQEIAFCQLLEEILLFGNTMESLPDTLPDLPFLRVLSVNYRSFSSVVDPYMDNLLKKGQIHSEFIPMVVFEMPMLESLDLEKTKINCLPEMFTNNLKHLCIADNYIKAFPETLFSMKSLCVFDMSKNSVSKLPDNIGTMNNLVSLKLNNNGYSVIPASIGELVNLIELEMAGNKIRTIPKEIKTLKKLQFLVLERNFIQALPQELCELTELETLDLSENCLKSVPLELYMLKKLTVAHSYTGVRKCGLWLYKNDLVEPPSDVWKTVDTQKIFDYLQQLKLRKMEDVNRQKLVLLGNSECGKTCLINSMVSGKTSFHNHETKLLTYTSWTTDNKVKLMIMDFAGGHSYNPVRQLFLDPNTLVLLVFDHTQYTDEMYDELIGRWIEVVLLYMPGSVVKLVSTRSDLQVDVMDEKLRMVMAAVRQHIKGYEKNITDSYREFCEELENVEQMVEQDQCTGRDALEIQEQKSRLERILAGLPLILDDVKAVSSIDGMQNSVVELILEIERIAVNSEYFPRARDTKGKHCDVVSSALKQQPKLYVSRESVKSCLPASLKISENEISECLKYLHNTGEIIVTEVTDGELLILPKPRGLVDLIWSLYRSDIKEFLNYTNNRLFSCYGLMTSDEFDIARDQYVEFGLISWPLLKCIWFHYQVSKQQILHFVDVLCRLLLCFEIPQPNIPQGPNFSVPMLAIAYFNRDNEKHADLLENSLFNPIGARQVELSYEFLHLTMDHAFEAIASCLQKYVTKRLDWSERVEALTNISKITITKQDSSKKITVTVQGRETTDIHDTLAWLNPQILQILSRIPGLVWKMTRHVQKFDEIFDKQCFPQNSFIINDAI